jgi:uncharacterized protein (TIGR04222 family)
MTLNPFDLTGFGFLSFYLAFGVAFVLGARYWIRMNEHDSARPMPQLSSDPYLIAYLRGGAQEAIKIAIISLVDRGLLEIDKDSIRAANTDAASLAVRPIERAILSRYAIAGKATKILAGADALPACVAYRKTLVQQGLLPGSAIYRARLKLLLTVYACLLAMSAIKISIAFAQGRHNVGFLVVLTLIFFIPLCASLLKRTTARGDALLSDLKTLFARLLARSKKVVAGGDTNEAALLAAVYGISALSIANFVFIKQLFPTPNGRSTGSDGGGCGSSCGSSGGSSCGGGGCGGGGCGG